MTEPKSQETPIESDVILKRIAQKLQEGSTEFKIGDEIEVLQSGTTGKVLRVIGDKVFFRTFDRPNGWCEHVATCYNVIKKKNPKRTNIPQKLSEFITKNNRKPFILKHDFTIVRDGKEDLLSKGETVFLDETSSFVDALKEKSGEGYEPSQCFIGFGSQNVFSILRCFVPKKDEFVYIPKKFLEPFKWNQQIFDKLSFPEKNRLKTFLESESNPEKYGSSFHKGNGKSILFYGDIGSGKTLTVEAISHKLKRPLIRLDVEERSSFLTILNTYLIAERYNGIVLVDEADTLISDRNLPTSRIEAIHTLLKYMESFSGITVFTTNYGTQIDPAIDNRIDLKIHYKLTPQIREDIWKKTLPSKMTGVFDFQKYSKSNLNGRDIQKIVLFACQKTNQQNLKSVPVKYIEEEIHSRLMEKEDFARYKYGISTVDYIG